MHSPLESVALLHEAFYIFAYIYMHHGLYVLRCLITQKLWFSSYMLITFRFHLSISCSCNFHDTISQQLHCRFRPYVSRKAATPSQSASHNPLIPIREMLGANKTTCPLPRCRTSKGHQTTVFKFKPFAGAGRTNSATSKFPNTSPIFGQDFGCNS